ncbi:MAG TPA: helicase C-terminal domain-containing protein [Stenomitos sp.]
MIEVEVHQQLRAWLREQGGDTWPHHLTVARLVARALRLQRKTLLQISSAVAYQGDYRLSYLASLLLWPGPILLVAPPDVQQALCHRELPQLREGLGLTKPVCTTTTWPHADFTGIAIISPQDWLQQELHSPHPVSSIPVVIDGVEDLESLTRKHLTHTLTAADWEALTWLYPSQVETIRDIRATLTYTLFQHPPNPYGCVVLAEPERHLAIQLIAQLQTQSGQSCPTGWQQFVERLEHPDTLTWANLDRQQGSFTLNSAPTNVAPFLKPLWDNRTIILLSRVLDLDPQAELFRLRLALTEATTVQFATDRHNDALTLYLPDGIPMPNTPEFAPALLGQLHRVLIVEGATETFSVLIIDDLPLKTRVAVQLAAEFGSRVKVERTDCEPGDVLITGWDFWLRHQCSLPHPQRLVIATLPFPSLENPIVAGRVAYYKQQRQDWFRLYLLPEALQILQKAIAPLRRPPGLIALFDSRVLHRSYGQQVLSALSPYARLTYLDDSTLMPPPCSV